MSATDHRADAVFTLPQLPKTAVVFGEPPGWTEGLGLRGVDVLDGRRISAPPDLAVATESRLEEALSSAAASVIVDGSRSAHRALMRRGLQPQRLLSLPIQGSPLVYVNLGHRRASAYGIRHGIVHPERWRVLRNELAANLAAFGLLPPSPHTLVAGSRDFGPPALLAAAEGLGVEGTQHWIMLISMGSLVRRNGLLLFGPRSDDPGWALKFARIPGFEVQFDREERGFGVVRATGGVVAAHSSRYQGRVVVGGYHASLETAAIGSKLSVLLRRPGERAEKTRMIERILDWDVRVAKETATPPDGLNEERELLLRDVTPFWTERGFDTSEWDRTPPIPAMFLHNDLVEENVVMRDGAFTILDWEWGQPRGLPFVDLIHFGVNALGVADGAGTEEERERHFVDLMTGSLPSSAVLFRWVREMRAALSIPADSVGLVVTLGLAKRGMVSEIERRRAEATTGETHGLPLAERVARAWLGHPDLGTRWRRWRN